MKALALFIQLKATKNTICFEEVPPVGQPPKIGRLYVQKWVFGQAIPDSVSVIIDTEVKGHESPAS